jgi:hypothetical protein
MRNTAVDLLTRLAARRYFQRLEVEMVLAFPIRTHPRAIYLTTAMVIEFCAIWNYRLYEVALTRARSIVSLKSLLAEDAAHGRNQILQLARSSERKGCPRPDIRASTMCLDG